MHQHLAKRHCLAHRTSPSRHRLQHFLAMHCQPQSADRISNPAPPPQSCFIAHREIEFEKKATVSPFTALPAPLRVIARVTLSFPQQVSSQAPHLGEYSRAHNRAKPQHQHHTPPLSQSLRPCTFIPTPVAQTNAHQTCPHDRETRPADKEPPPGTPDLPGL